MRVPFWVPNFVRHPKPRTLNGGNPSLKNYPFRGPTSAGRFRVWGLGFRVWGLGFRGIREFSVPQSASVGLSRGTGDPERLCLQRFADHR